MRPRIFKLCLLISSFVLLSCARQGLTVGVGYNPPVYSNLSLAQYRFAPGFKPQDAYALMVQPPVLEETVNDALYPLTEAEDFFYKVLIQRLSFSGIPVRTTAVESGIKRKLYALETRITRIDAGNSVKRAWWIDDCSASVTGRILDPDTGQTVFEFSDKKSKDVWDGTIFSPGSVRPKLQSDLDHIAASLVYTLKQVF